MAKSRSVTIGGVTYSSILEASKDVGYSYTYLSKKINRGDTECNGVPMSAGPIEKRRRVMCIETGEVYDSIKKAAKAHGVSSATLSLFLNRKNNCKTCAGHTWEYIKEERA